MKIKHMLASAAVLALAACGQGGETDTAATDNMAMDNMAATDNMAAPADAAVPATGQEYATMAAASDMYEIEAARLAAEKAQNADVKSLAEMIRADHEKSTADLKTAAGQAQPPITVTAAMNPEQQSMVQALQGASGADFDRTYLDQQVQAHQKALAMVQGYAQNGDVEGLKKHASTVAGPIQQHLQRAQELQTSAAR
jgi:putative membrane protein